MTLQQSRTQEALRALPSAGWVGRRDRAVLVLSQMAGMSDEDIAGLTAGDMVIADGAATISAPTGTNAAGIVLPRLAAQLAALRQQRAEVAEQVEELVAAHRFPRS